MAVVAVPFILYLVRFCSPKPYKKKKYPAVMTFAPCTITVRVRLLEKIYGTGNRNRTLYILNTLTVRVRYGTWWKIRRNVETRQVRYSTRTRTVPARLILTWVSLLKVVYIYKSYLRFYASLNGYVISQVVPYVVSTLRGGFGQSLHRTCIDPSIIQNLSKFCFENCILYEIKNTFRNRCI